MSRRKANTTINLSLRFQDVQTLHCKTLHNVVVKACSEAAELINVQSEFDY